MVIWRAAQPQSFAEAESPGKTPAKLVRSTRVEGEMVKVMVHDARTPLSIRHRGEVI